MNSDDDFSPQRRSFIRDLAAATILPFAAACAGGGSREFTNASTRAEFDWNKICQTFQMRDQYGHIMEGSDLIGKKVAVYFPYMNCGVIEQGVCTTVLSNIKNAYDDPRFPVDGSVVILTPTINPWEDREETINSRAEGYDIPGREDWRMVRTEGPLPTRSKETCNKNASNLYHLFVGSSIDVGKDELRSFHTSRIFVIGPDGNRQAEIEGVKGGVVDGRLTSPTDMLLKALEASQLEKQAVNGR